VDSQIQHNFDTELVESAHRQLYPALLDVRQSRIDADTRARTS
jgi:two-component system OmpR family sensor kinase